MGYLSYWIGSKTTGGEMKIIKIKKCLHCPHADGPAIAGLLFCYYEGETVDENSIPTWCPLEDAPDGQPEVK